ncbi:MAG: hypothetical protein IIY62_01630 [Kiritimatiellae bacterium]|nr:hypothetical protein [Kiritimatiellia bacterium]MBQ1345039.1 hypothetical protein [Kiritimatiellia bacterium]
MADNETIADIIAWLRRPRGGENAYLTLWRDEIADRLEAAHKRERENYDAKIADLQLRVKLWTDRSDELVKKCVEQYAKLKQVGNSAKLREALIKAITMLAVCEWPDGTNMEGVEELRRDIDAALAAPPRNCDVIGNTGRALLVHGFPTKSNQWGEGEWLEFIDWLLAPATEKEGGIE